MVASKAEKSRKAEFDPSNPEPLVVRYGNASSGVASVAASSVEFQDKGIAFETSEPKESGSQVRHVVFVPYSSLVDIRQDYVA
jgi:hypothetical protein